MMNNSLKYTVLSILLTAMTGCSENSITQGVGSLPDETPMLSIGGQLYSGETFLNKKNIRMYEGDEPITEKIGYMLTKPAASAISITIEPSPELVAEYNSDNNTDMKVFPSENVNIEKDGTLTIASGQNMSESISAILSSEGLENGVPYLLAITVKQKSADMQSDNQTLYYRIALRKKRTTTETSVDGVFEIPPLCPNLLSVFYVNTEEYQPLVAAAWGVYAEDFINYPVPAYSLGHIVNLKKSTIDYDATTNRCMFKPGEDLLYVLEHRDKYIRHLQENGRKVCICIENGGKGVGFCNMNDAQITDFVNQVKEVVIRYGIDGINLWDEDNKYKENGIPELTTTSYPKLIKALRDAMPDKLLTLVDKGNATDYFYDSNLCGGIEVGSLIDYAWHGYVSGKEPMHIVQPGTQEQPYNEFNRKRIAGLDDKCYGNVNIARYLKSYLKYIGNWVTEPLAKYKSSHQKKNNILVFGEDLKGQEYKEEEGSVNAMIDHINYFMDDGDGWDFDADDIWLGDVWYYMCQLDKNVGNPGDNGYHKDW